MSKPVKKLLRDELVQRIEGVTELAVVGFAGVPAGAANAIRARLREKDIRVRVVKNALARQAFQEIGIGQAGEMLHGPCALAWGADSVVTIVRELRDICKEHPKLEVKAAFLDGSLFGSDQIEALSKFPTREEAIAQVLGCVLSAGANVAACLIGPGAQLAGILKAIEEKSTPDPVPAPEGEGAEAAA